VAVNKIMLVTIGLSPAATAVLRSGTFMLYWKIPEALAEIRVAIGTIAIVTGFV